jgi:hypothetical protein
MLTSSTSVAELRLVPGAGHVGVPDALPDAPAWLRARAGI